MDITITEVEQYGKTYYDIRRDGKQFCLSNAQFTTAQDRDLTEAIAQALPAGLTVQFRPAKARALGSTASWTVYDGERTIARVTKVEDIIPATLREVARPQAPAAPVETTPEPKAARTPQVAAKKGRCENCSRHSARLVLVGDMSGIPGWVCIRCSADDMFSFA